MTPIATCWHTLMDAAREGRSGVLALDDAGESLLYLGEDALDKTQFAARAREIGSKPRFVLEDKALELLNTDQAARSIGDMITCEVLGLPLPASEVARYRLKRPPSLPSVVGPMKGYFSKLWAARF